MNKNRWADFITGVEYIYIPQLDLITANFWAISIFSQQTTCKAQVLCFPKTKGTACRLAGLPVHVLDFPFLWSESARMSKYSYESDILPDNYSLKRFIHLAEIQSVYMIG